MTHKNRFKAVTDHGYVGTKAVYAVTGMAIDRIIGTGNHPFYVRKRERIWNNERRVYERTFNEPEWKRLDELSNDYYLGTAINTNEINDIGITDEECWLVGRYIADGHIRDQQRPNRPAGCSYHTTVFSVGRNKADEFRKHLISHKAGESAENNVIRFSISSHRLANLCRLCGKGAANKEIPTLLLDLPAEKLRHVISGLMDGDGCYTFGHYSVTTVSRKLAYTIAQAVTKVYHATYSIYEIPVPETKTIEGRVVHQRTQYQIRYKYDIRKQDKAFYEDGYIWSPLTNVTPYGKEATYNLSVAEDESYCVQNIIVHNCQGLSVAGMKKGLADERSGLFIEQIRIVKEMRERDKADGRTDIFIRPRWLIWENVSGSLSSSKGKDFQTVLTEIARVADPECPDVPLPGTGKWDKYGCVYDKLGRWSIAWRLHDAQFWGTAFTVNGRVLDLGTPQRRKRIALVADFGGMCAPEILFIRKGLYGYITESCEERKAFARNIGESLDTAGKAYTLKVRGGAERDCYGKRAGKGALIQTEMSGTLGVSQDQTVFQHIPTVALEGNGSRPSHFGDGYKETDVMYTLNSIEQHAVAHNQTSRVYDARGNGSGNISPTITGDHQNRITDYTAIILEEQEP